MLVDMRNFNLIGDYSRLDGNMNNGNFMRREIRSLIEGIEPLDLLEAHHLAQTLAWIDADAPLFRTQKPATPPQHLVSYFVVVDPTTRHLLLTDHKDAGLWLPSGGHVEPDEHPHDAAAREAQEELGITADFLFPDPLFLTVTETQGMSAGHTDVSLWYALRGDSNAVLAHDPGEFHGISWFAFEALPSTRVEPHLARFVAKLCQQLAKYPITE